MIRQAFVSGGVSYHHALTEPGGLLSGWEMLDIGRLAAVDLNRYDVVLVPRSTDGEMLYARRHQFARFLDRGGVLLAFGELWTNWFPGCQWVGECHEDILEPVIANGHASDHPLVAGYSAHDLHWHPAKERWCCHGHLLPPPGAEVLVRNQQGDAWLYIDRTTTNGVVLASSNLDPDTHAFHGSQVARGFFERLIDWGQVEAAASAARREQKSELHLRQARKIAGYYSGVHFQHAFYADPEFAPRFVVLPAAELEATNLHDYAALWIPRESNQDVLCQQREKLVRYLSEGGTLLSFEEVNRPGCRPAGGSSARWIWTASG